MVKIKVRKKSVLLVLLLFVFAYVCSHIEDKIGNLLPRKKLPLKDSKGYVNCAAVDNYCYRSEFNLDILGEVVSKSVVLCSSGRSIGVVTIPNLSTFFHIIEIPSSYSLLTQKVPEDEKDDVGSQNLRTFIKSYGSDNVFKISDFIDETPESSHLLVLAYTGVETPAEDLQNEVVRLFGSQIFIRMKSGNLYYGLYSKKKRQLIAEASTTFLDKVHKSLCLSNYSQLIANEKTIAKISAKESLVGQSSQGLECYVKPSEMFSANSSVIKCNSNSVPVNVFSTSNGDNFPEYCVNGRTIKYSNSRHKLGRGLHLMVFSPAWELHKYEVYDTYDRKVDSDNLYQALMSISPKSIVILATHDEASNKLSDNVKGILFRYGSSAVARMRYRDSWVFVGQKGLNGKTLFEQLVSKKTNQDFAATASIQTCVPKQLPVKQWIDTLNDNLALFCARQVLGYESVCQKNITFPPESKKPEPKGWSEFFESSPLLVIPDLARYEAHVSLYRTLESIAKQPHLEPSMVFVALCKNDFVLEFSEIVEIFGYTVMTFDYRKYQCFEVPKRDAFNRLFGNMQFKQAVVIDAEVYVQPDFLHYIFSLSPILHQKNSDVISVAGWNPNSFQQTDGPVDALIRVDNFPLYGWVLTRSLNQILSKTKEGFKSCCGDKKWYEGWDKPDKRGVVVIPALSRVSIPYVEEGFDIETVKFMLYSNNRIDSSSIAKPFDISFDTSYTVSTSAYQKHLKSRFRDCKLFILSKPADLTNLKSAWEKILQESQISKSVKVLNGTNNATRVSQTSMRRNSHCVIAMVKSLVEQSNREITRNLFKFLHLAHTQPFGYHNGAIVSFKSSVPFLLLESNSSLAKAFV